jgi:ubiquinone/menaquinone biosynthesis C-methylase UbiE
METSPAVHAALIQDQFTRQAHVFSASPELHNDAVLSLFVNTAKPAPGDRMLDIACGPGTVVAAFSPYVAHAEGLDATAAMLAEAKTLSEANALANVQWRQGSVYSLPYPTNSFDIVTCRFAFHHFEDPRAAFSEMVRVASSAARIVLGDAVVSDDKEKADAFNKMERFRDPSTVEFRTLDFLRNLFVEAGLGSPAIERFQVPYLAHEFVERSFPVREDRAGLLRLIENSVAGDLLGMNARKTAQGVHIAFQAVVLSATKPEA